MIANLVTYVTDNNMRVLSLRRGRFTSSTILNSNENLASEIKNLLKCYKVSEFNVRIVVDKKAKDVTCKIDDVTELITYL
jgi:hypothetical protein